MASAAMSFTTRTKPPPGGHCYIMNRLAFLPKDTTPLHCGTKIINVYPRLSATAEDDEKSHAFHVTSAALEVATFIKHNARATFLSEHFGLSSEMILLNSEMLDKWNAL